MRLLSKDQTAEELGVSVRTLARWSELGFGPAPCRLGRHVFYTDESVRSWIDRQVMAGEKIHAQREQAWLQTAR